MNEERLLIQIDVLEQIAALDRLLDMSGWIQEAPTRDEPCRTACCAFGYAALDPRLQEQGLTLVGYTNARRKVLIRSSAEFNRFAKAGALDGIVYPAFGDAEGFTAAMEFYGITRRAANYLFDPEWYPARRGITAEAVAERVREVIAHDGDAPWDAEDQGAEVDEEPEDEGEDEDEDFSDRGFVD